MIPNYVIPKRFKPPKKLFNFLNRSKRPKYYKNAIRKLRKDII